MCLDLKNVYVSWVVEFNRFVGLAISLHDTIKAQADLVSMAVANVKSHELMSEAVNI